MAEDTVVFKNRGKQIHWPASNIHPTHQIYSEFDPKETIPPGGDWSFKFDKVGEWKMHDHVYPNFTGLIIVKENPNQPQSQTTTVSKKLIPTPPADIKSQLAKVAMLTVANNLTDLKKWMEIAGPKEIMEDLLLDSGNGAAVDCHQQAHYVGRLAYEIYGSPVFKYGTSLCHSGFYHGGIEEFLKEEGTTDLTNKVKKVCDSFETLFGRFECLHGIGHGLMAYEDYDLPKALKLCGGLPTIYEQSSCYGGVFMENIVTAQGLGAGGAAHATKWTDRNDPHMPCNKIGSDETALTQCYLMQTSWMLTLFNYNFDPVIAECKKAPSGMISTCFRSLGRDAAGNSLRNVPKILETCDKVKEENYYNDCLAGALNVIVDFWGDSLSHQATALCALSPEKGKSNCYNTLFSRLNGIFTDEKKIEDICFGFEKDYLFLCD